MFVCIRNTFVELFNLLVDCLYTYIRQGIFACALKNIFVETYLYMHPYAFFFDFEAILTRTFPDRYVE